MSNSYWEPCWACRLVAGERCGHIVHESAAVIVALNPFAIHPGHSLVMPKRHIPNVYELPDDLAGPVLATAAEIARVVKRTFGADGITLRQNNDAASDQHLFHFHLHVIPRFAGDGERFLANVPMSGEGELAKAAAAIRQALRE
jgi:histidine triad (HIT) family protein